MNLLEKKLRTYKATFHPSQKLTVYLYTTLDIQRGPDIINRRGNKYHIRLNSKIYSMKRCLSFERQI